MFQKESFRENIKLIMTIDEKIRDEEIHYNINRKAAKISALSSGTIGKYEYLTDEKLLPPDHSRKIEKAKLTYSKFKKSF